MRKLHKNSILILILSLIVCAFSHSANAQDNPEWSKEYKPFRIVGNLYYVGTYDLACYLITTTKGNILINTGLASSAEMIKANIEKLGFKFSDTKILLITQGHYDHTAALAKIKEMTGARLYANEKDSGILAAGGKSDFAFGDRFTFAPVTVDRTLHDRDTIRLGNTVLTMLHHPGHTKGSSSYTFTATDQGKDHKVLIVNMPSIVIQKPFSQISAYPDIAKDYAYTLNALKNLQFDIWVSSHASQFGLHSKHKPADPYNPSAFIDRAGYDAEVRSMEESYLKKLKEN